MAVAAAAVVLRIKGTLSEVASASEAPVVAVVIVAAVSAVSTGVLTLYSVPNVLRPTIECECRLTAPSELKGVERGGSSGEKGLSTMTIGPFRFVRAASHSSA